MRATQVPIQYLLTLPPLMAESFERLEKRSRPIWYASSDPPGKPLGSGGGTASLLADAWRETGDGRSFSDWLASSRKLILHAGGQSRRLPAYAPTGKLLMPMPVIRWSYGQRLDQTLLDLQLPAYQRVLSHAGPHTAAMVTSGDVLLRFSPELPPFPEVDVLGLGMWVAPEKAKDFGVFFTPRTRPTELTFFLQKPSPATIREYAREYLCLVDTGMWLFSERALRVLMKRSGWSWPEERFPEGAAKYELYSQFAMALGSKPTTTDPAVAELSCAVLPLPEAEFYHFGTSAQMIESVAELQTLVLDETKIGRAGVNQRPDQVTQNSRFSAALKREGNECFWVENSVIPSTWNVASRHVLTGVPENEWRIRLPAGVCLDFVPLRDNRVCLRAYGFEDAFSGKCGNNETLWLNRPMREWFAQRGIEMASAGIDLEGDIQAAPLFPVLGTNELDARFLAWLWEPVEGEPVFSTKWVGARRISAQQIMTEVDLDRVYESRAKLRRGCIPKMVRNFRYSVVYRLDLESTARDLVAGNEEVPDASLDSQDDPVQVVHDRMLRSAVKRHAQQQSWTRDEAQAFALLREVIAKEAQLSPGDPRLAVLEDQIVWARSPVRLDLAGGWTDTPPYCIEHGGKVLNVAVDLNGQPPIQVFAKLSDAPELVLRSIDLGVEERVRTYEDLDNYARPENPFSLAKAAFALAGFLPRFHTHGTFGSLEQQLKSFGGGLELSLLAAVPKGSGLGTSSILAATVLAAIGEICGLGWDKRMLFSRTLALEQMLTTGGGWQDQAGAIYRGVKLIETTAGLEQKPSVRWYPTSLLDRESANSTVLLYYTGITRMAKNILGEIVRGLFLNSPIHLDIIRDIGANAEYAGTALQRCDRGMLCEAVRRSWDLNQELDSGTNPPAVQGILQTIDDYVEACKLLGAGGGGYLLMFGKDAEASLRIRKALTESPPNRRARFVDFSVSETGLQITRS